ncbi:hypothetical protein Bpfe_018540 [Biomphalaria pfeifferi]|uniref:Uncharacterized protein n=1 Tax=Biomphalaria pfeifferi TaxID=112525 RepID=A0AAD8F627_BIOPF|nr:hypothetical protein Bpfe_018540 [Biomphalaria pfeifferi]
MVTISWMYFVISLEQPRSIDIHKAEAMKVPEEIASDRKNNSFPSSGPEVQNIKKDILSLPDVPNDLFNSI